jgi:hypothetical protein
LMRVALLLLCVLACASCPRQTNETVPVAHAPPQAPNVPMAPSATQLPNAAKQPTTANAPVPGKPTPVTITKIAGPEIKPPIAYMELGTGFTPAPLPADVPTLNSAAKVSRDKSEAEFLEAGDLVWFQGFASKASEEELNNYYNGLLGVKGFGSKDVKRGKVKTHKAKKSWRSPDGRYSVYLYSADSAAPAGVKPAKPVYFVEVDEHPVGSSGGTGP